MYRNGSRAVSHLIYFFFFAYTTPHSRFQPSDKTEECRRLGVGRLLSDLSLKMDSKSKTKSRTKVKKGILNGNENGEGEDGMKILVHCTHDTALSALMATFDVYDEK